MECTHCWEEVKIITSTHQTAVVTRQAELLLKCIRDKWWLQGLFSDAFLYCTVQERNSENSAPAVIQVMSKRNLASVICYCTATISNYVSDIRWLPATS